MHKPALRAVHPALLRCRNHGASRRCRSTTRLKRSLGGWLWCSGWQWCDARGEVVHAPECDGYIDRSHVCPQDFCLWAFLFETHGRWMSRGALAFLGEMQARPG